MANTPEVADIGSYRDQVDWLAPGREIAGALGLPTRVCAVRLATKGSLATS